MTLFKHKVRLYDKESSLLTSATVLLRFHFNALNTHRENLGFRPDIPGEGQTEYYHLDMFLLIGIYDQ